MNIIALPFAGGSSLSYQLLKKYFSKSCSVEVLEYSGRGYRATGTLLTSMQAVVNDLFPALVQKANSGVDYVLYGHSMGALVGLMLCRKLYEQRQPLPSRLIVSGKAGPAARHTREVVLHKIGKDAFWSEVFSIGGTPQELNESQDFREYFEPILRADFQVVETFSYEESAPLPIPIQVLYGDKEGLDVAVIEKWQQESVFPISHRALPGNHFFIFDNARTVASVIEAGNTA
ncbi:MAG: thioesterase II family protein [Janthinobacterium lividum]